MSNLDRRGRHRPQRGRAPARVSAIRTPVGRARGLRRLRLHRRQRRGGAGRWAWRRSSSTSSTPFTAARARNAGFDRLSQARPRRAIRAVRRRRLRAGARLVRRAPRPSCDAQPDAAVVFGRCRERHPEASVYNRLCDIEWDRPVGERKTCGGDRAGARRGVPRGRRVRPGADRRRGAGAVRAAAAARVARAPDRRRDDAGTTPT